MLNSLIRYRRTSERGGRGLKCSLISHRRRAAQQGRSIKKIFFSHNILIRLMPTTHGHRRAHTHAHISHLRNPFPGATALPRD